MDSLDTLISAKLPRIIRNALALDDLEAHLCALVLDGSNVFSAEVSRLLSTEAAEPQRLRRTVEVATAGIRLALGVGERHRHAFGAAAKRELEREPMPPAFCARDEPRILAAIAAGVGVAAPEIAQEFSSWSRTARDSRAVALGSWADTLATGQREYGARVATAVESVLRKGIGGASDPLSEYWMCARLLRANWMPDDEQISTVAEALAAARQASFARLLEGPRLTGFEAALLFDALTTSAPLELQRRSALEAAIAVVDAFPASVRVLSERREDRKAFEIRDEYDAQDLFRALLLPRIPDLTPEDPAPKLAGRSSRLDFVSRRELLGFELKFIHQPRDRDKVRKEILIDEGTYQRHPYVRTVLAFVYDPHRHLAESDRPAFEADLSGPRMISGRTVDYWVRVR